MISNLLAGPMFGVTDNGIIIFSFEIYYYAFCIVGGILVATLLSALLMKRRNMSPDLIFTLFLICIPSALIGARLFYCVTGNVHISDWFSFKSIREGGLSVIGGVLFGVGAGYIVCKCKKVEFLRAADCVVVNILIAQAIGRWGNFFNGEVYGGVVKDPAMQWFPLAVPISSNSSLHGIGSFSDPNATWHYAFFFYEMAINLVGWAILFTYTWFRKKKPNGLPTCLYFVWYGLVRTVMEPMRDPQFILNAKGTPWSLLFSILMWGLGIIAILTLLLVNHYKEGAFLGSERGDPCGITQFAKAYKTEEPYFSKINMFGSNYPPAPLKEKKKKESDPPPDDEEQKEE